MATVTYDSILGGQAGTSNFAGRGQFYASLGIDPAQPIDDSDTNFSTIASGLLRPAASQKFSGTTVTSAPLWMKTNPKDSNVYVYDANGSAYTVDSTISTVTALADGGSLTGSLGNGLEYNDNYMYFATNTDVKRYGPLNGAPGFSSYFVTGLGFTAMTNTVYPTTFKNNLAIPNHPMHRHSDGALYVGDVVGNRGAIHKIQTSFTAVEGDTNNGSFYYKLTFGYGLWPTAIETLGTDLAVALIEGSNTGLRQMPAKIGFWDTISTAFNKITWVEFPDPLITAMKNVNGVLYVVSGSYQTRGFRISKFTGGYSFSEVFYSEVGEPCLQGAIDATLDRCVFGSHTTIPESDGCVFGIGLQKRLLSNGVFNVMRSTGGTSSTNVTAVCFADATEMGFYAPIIGWTQAGDGSTGVSHGLDKQGTQYNNAPSVMWFPKTRIGAPFVINSIHIPFTKPMAANMIVTAKLYSDDGASSQTLQVINNTTYPNSEKSTKTLRNIGFRGEQNFWLELRWTGSALLTLGLPVKVDFEVMPD